MIAGDDDQHHDRYRGVAAEVRPVAVGKRGRSRATVSLTAAMYPRAKTYHRTFTRHIRSRPSSAWTPVRPPRRAVSATATSEGPNSSYQDQGGARTWAQAAVGGDEERPGERVGDREEDQDLADRPVDGAGSVRCLERHVTSGVPDRVVLAPRCEVRPVVSGA